MEKGVMKLSKLNKKVLKIVKERKTLTKFAKLGKTGYSKNFSKTNYNSKIE